IDGRTDIYSLGAVLYELVCGRRLFQGSTEDELIDQILSREPKPPRQINDSIPRRLELVCMHALSKRIGDRYTTAKDMADDLRRIVFPKGPHRHFQIEEQPTATILRVTTEHIDGEKEIASFRDELYRLVERIKAPRVILDFHEVLNFPSGALDPLLVARKKALDRGGELRICGLDEVLTQSIFTGNKIAA